MKRLCTFAALAALLLACGTAARAADYLEHPVQLVVPYPAGGSTDLAARLFATELSQRMKQAFVVVNRPGAGTLIGAREVVRSQPDGHTLLYTTTSTSLVALLNRNASLNFKQDLAPVALTLTAPMLLVANPSVPANNMVELLALLRSQPQKYNFAYPGMGGINHLATVLFARDAKVKAELIPYKGNADSLQALLGGSVQLAFDAISSAKPHVDSGKLKAIAVSSLERSSALPNVPTVDASGLPRFDAIFWNGFFAPAGTPPAVLERLNREIDAIVHTPRIRQKLVELGSEPAGGSIDDFKRRVDADLDRWGRIIRDNAIHLE